MRTKEEYEDAVIELQDMLFDDESITLHLYKQCKDRIEILKELIENYKENDQ